MSTAAASRLTGADFERIVESRLAKYKTARLAHVKRYGVQAVRSQEQWHIIRSKPDFEGVVPGGRQVIFDCKVESSASFDLSQYRPEIDGPKKRQLTHMFERAEYDVYCFFLIHWNPRELATKSEPGITYAFPVDSRMEFWQQFLAGEVRRITRSDCAEYGRSVPWSLFGPRDSVAQPDLLSVL
jgi:penicillin-binding protein-related factor A (putative recombinase)